MCALGIGQSPSAVTPRTRIQPSRKLCVRQALGLVLLVRSNRQPNPSPPSTTPTNDTQRQTPGHYSKCEFDRDNSLLFVFYMAKYGGFEEEEEEEIFATHGRMTEPALAYTAKTTIRKTRLRLLRDSYGRRLSLGRRALLEFSYVFKELGGPVAGKWRMGR